MNYYSLLYDTMVGDSFVNYNVRDIMSFTDFYS